jgi:TP901 family phage tail tape measure protein
MPAGINLGAAFITVLPDTSKFGTVLRAALRPQLDAATSGLTGVRGAVATAGRDLAAIGTKLTVGITLPVAAATAEVAKLGIQFQHTFGQIRGLIAQPVAEVNRLEDVVLDLAKTLPLAPNELAQALLRIEQDGLRGSRAVEVLNASAKLAATGLADLFTVADATVSIVNAYADTGLTAAHVTDVFVAAAREGKLSIQDLVTGIGHVIGPAHEFGVSFEEVVGALAAGARISIPVSRMAVALRFLLTSLEKPSAQAAKALTAIGLTAEDLRQVIADRGLVAALQLLHDNLTETQFLQVIGGARGSVAALTLVGKAANGSAIALNAVKNASGDTDVALKAVSETVEFKLKTALSAAQAAGIRFGDILLPVIGKVADAAADFAKRIEELPEAQKRAIATATLLAAALGPVLLVLGSLARTVVALGPSFAILSNPLALVIAALAALAIYSPQVRDAFRSLWPELVKIGHAALDLYNVVKPLADQLYRMAVQVVTGVVVPALRGLFDILGPLIRGIAEFIRVADAIGGPGAVVGLGLLATTAGALVVKFVAARLAVSALGTAAIVGDGAALALAGSLQTAATAAGSLALKLGPVAVVVGSIVGYLNAWAASNNEVKTTEERLVAALRAHKITLDLVQEAVDGNRDAQEEVGRILGLQTTGLQIGTQLWSSFGRTAEEAGNRVQEGSVAQEHANDAQIRAALLAGPVIHTQKQLADLYRQQNVELAPLTLSTRQFAVALDSLKTVAQFTGLNFADLKGQLAAALAGGPEAIDKFITDAESALDDFKKQIAGDFDFVGQAFQELAQNDKLTAAGIVKGLRDTLKVADQFKSDWTAVSKSNIKGTQDFLLQVAALGTDGARFLHVFAGAGKDTQKQIVGYFEAIRAAQVKLQQQIERPLIRAINRLVAALDSIPRDVESRISTPGARTAQDAVDALKASLRELPRNVGIRIGVNVVQTGDTSLVPGPGGGRVIGHTGGPVEDLPRVHRGGLAPDERPAILQTGEFVMRRHAVGTFGTEFFRGLNRMHEGGLVGDDPISKIDKKLQDVIERLSAIFSMGALRPRKMGNVGPAGPEDTWSTFTPVFIRQKPGDRLFNIWTVALKLAPESQSSLEGVKTFGDSLAKLPTEKSVAVSAPGAQTAQGHVDALHASLRGLPRNVGIRIGVNIAQTGATQLVPRLGGRVLQAQGGIAFAREGMIAKAPTFLADYGMIIGEGRYPTFAGRGAEANVPLDSRGIGILAKALAQAQVVGGGGRPARSAPLIGTLNWQRASESPKELVDRLTYESIARGY